jgi:hypothetical protein
MARSSKVPPGTSEPESEAKRHAPDRVDKQRRAHALKARHEVSPFLSWSEDLSGHRLTQPASAARDSNYGHRSGAFGQIGIDQLDQPFSPKAPIMPTVDHLHGQFAQAFHRSHISRNVSAAYLIQ